MTTKRNRERVYTKEEYLKDKKKNLKNFSEGNKALYKLLEYCWNNNITTVACCAHEPYISFKIKDLNEPMGGLLTVGIGYRVSFGFRELMIEEEIKTYTTCGLHFWGEPTQKETTKFFKAILDKIKEKKNFLEELEHSFEEVSDIIQDIVHKHLNNDITNTDRRYLPLCSFVMGERDGRKVKRFLKDKGWDGISNSVWLGNSKEIAYKPTGRTV